MSNPGSRIEVKPALIYAHRPKYYFGYGLESVPEVMEAIVGHTLVAELGVVAVERQLAVQDFDQIPNIPIEALGGKSAQEDVVEAWKKHTDAPFSSYALRRSLNRGDVVAGTLFEINMYDAEALVEWDLANPGFGEGQWRYWDHLIKLADGRPAMTLTIAHDQEVDRTVNGVIYDPFLNDKDVTMHVIQDVFNER